jgi:hypothetical protein
MIAEIIPEIYDAEGKKVFRPDMRRKSRFRPTFPMGRFLSQPLKIKCSSFEKMRHFLMGCEYVSDEKQFDKKDFWQPPEQFEKTRKGDCDDFALWSWRQLMDMGYPARFVVGTAGRFGEGHAWVTFEKDGKVFLFDPVRCAIGYTMPSLSTRHYKPEYSVACENDKAVYFSHQDTRNQIPVGKFLTLLPHWLLFWSWTWIFIVATLPLGLLSWVVRFARRKLASIGSK